MGGLARYPAITENLGAIGVAMPYGATGGSSGWATKSPLGFRDSETIKIKLCIDLGQRGPLSKNAVLLQDLGSVKTITF